MMCHLQCCLSRLFVVSVVFSEQLSWAGCLISRTEFLNYSGMMEKSMDKSCSKFRKFSSANIWIKNLKFLKQVQFSKLSWNQFLLFQSSSNSMIFIFSRPLHFLANKLPAKSLTTLQVSFPRNSHNHLVSLISWINNDKIFFTFTEFSSPPLSSSFVYTIHSPLIPRKKDDKRIMAKNHFSW